MILAVWNLLLPAAAVVALIVLFHGEAKSRQMQKVIAKAVASSCFVALAISRYDGSVFGAWMLAALALGAVGDMLLLGDRSFELGLLVFLVGHVCYVIAFEHRLPMKQWPRLLAVPLLLLAVAVCAWLWRHLGRRRIPVVLYIATLAVMVWAAVSTAYMGALWWWAAVAAVLFMVSDLTVARQRFVKQAFVNRAVGLPMYYSAQFLFALTIGH